jgi:S1-C subfamily serine protease
MGQDDSRAMQDPLVNESEQPAPGSHDYRSPQFSSHEYTTNDYAGMPEPPESPVRPKPAETVPSFPHRPARSMATAMLAAGLVLGSIGGGAVGALIATRHTNAVSTQTNSGTTTAGVAAPAPSPGSYAAIYQQTKDGVVTISTQVSGRGFRSFAQAQGSGVVLDKQGDILTNAHVVDGATRVQVTFADGHNASGQVKGVDQSADLAVVQVSGSQDELHPLAIGNSDTLQVGDTALAIGSPFGLQGSFTAGIVSGLNRTTTAPNGRALTGMIQTDAPINPGNSGGALVDLTGRLVGINTAILAPGGGSVGIGFAVPVNMARGVMDQLIRFGEIKRGVIGVSIQDLTPDLAGALNVQNSGGALVAGVEPNSAAEKAGVQKGDVVIAMDGVPVASATQLRNRIGLKRVGSQAELTVLRDGTERTLRVRIDPGQVRSRSDEE